MDTSDNPPLLTLLSSEVIAALKSVGHQLRFEDGQRIHARGDKRPGLSIILSGRVRFGVYGEDGGYIQAGLLSEGHCFGEVTLFVEKPRAYDADAFGETVILEIRKPKFESVAAAHPQVSNAMLVTLTGRIYEALEFADDLRSCSLEVRVAKQLMRMSVSGGFSGDVLPIRQTDLAYALGLSRVSVGKALIALQERNLVELGYGEIKISDQIELRRWAANGDRAES